MPPAAKSVALMLILAGPACLAAQTSSPASASHFASTPRENQTGPPGLEQAEDRLRIAVASDSGMVKPVGHHAPVPAPNDPRGSPSRQRSPSQADPQPQVDRAERVPLSPPDGNSPIRLKPHSRAKRAASGDPEDRPGGLSSLLTVGSSLAVVLGLFLVVAWIVRRAAPLQSALLPKEVVEVLGRMVLANRTQLQLLRCGNKLLLVSVTPAGVETLTEITDPDEVNRLAGLCRQGQPGSATAAFRQVFQQLAGQRTGAGRAGRTGENVPPAGAGILSTRDDTWEDQDG